jgi:hypothetical protein
LQVIESKGDYGIFSKDFAKSFAKFLAYSVAGS